MSFPKLKVKKNWWTQFIFFMGVSGPGLITANLDNDAGGIATYSAAGAQTGLRLLWVMLPVTISLIFMQTLSARLAILTGKGLSDLIRENFGMRATFYTLCCLIVADLGNTMAEFAGVAAAGDILGFPKYITVPCAALFAWLLILKGNYKTVEKVFLLGCSVFLAYIVNGIIIGPDWHEVFKAALIPRPDRIISQDWPIIVGLIGTTITPWMQFYLQSAIVEKGLREDSLTHTKWDVIIGCLFMYLVAAFIVICCAVVIFPTGKHIESAADAAMALGPLAGRFSETLFAFGLLNASIFAGALLPLATSYYVCEGMGWESGVDKNWEEAPQFFTIFSTLIGIAAALVLIPGINLLKILLTSQIINGVLIPFVFWFMLQLCQDPEVLGDKKLPRSMIVLGYTILSIMVVANSMMVFYLMI